MIAEAGVNWGNSRQLNRSRQAFFSTLGRGSLQTSHNTHVKQSSTYSRGPNNSLPGGVCQWMNQHLASRTVHYHSDHLGRFAIALINGPCNQGIAIITAYCPIDGVNSDISVAIQHRRVLGQDSDPRERCLEDLGAQIAELQQQGYSIIVGIDANESISEDLFPTEGLNLFLQSSGLMNPINHYHGQCPFPTSSALQGTPINSIFCTEDLLPFHRDRCVKCSTGSQL